MVRITPEGVVEYRIGGNVFDRADVWHVKAYTTPGQPVGLSPVEYARQTVGLGLAAEKFGARFFGDGAMPSGMLTSPTKLDKEQRKDLRDEWDELHGSKRRVAVLHGGLKFDALSIRPDESQFIETLALNVRSICRIFGVPPEMVGAESGASLTYANVEQRALDFVRFCLSPWLYRLETALSALLPRQQYVKFNAGGLLRSTTKERYEAHKIALDAGFMTVNEVRAIEDMPPLAGGQ